MPERSSALRGVEGRAISLRLSANASKREYTGFARGYVFGKTRNLRALSISLPEGISICSSYLVCGIKHIERVLRQSVEYWERDKFLARNKSIDLLLRLTCQRQISKAIELSNVEKIRRAVLFGLVSDGDSIILAEKMMLNTRASPENEVLKLDAEKSKFLRSVHTLPSWIPDEMLDSILQEKAVGLAFSK